ncbi:MAG: hypothetical protein RMZ43_008980 [Nostoc sp. CmiVER01]|uniref:hypothetical protein n=1 Tax=Nostoc sp. CmiVER01 TaxID=3075384 RepID=UPI002AD23C4E|nr:hypothetical protein [Nostoc sp. CmiVER01]MDZ8123429.1 hypothetical protein [Nostoc sp. CmiVER01]
MITRSGSTEKAIVTRLAYPIIRKFGLRSSRLVPRSGKVERLWQKAMMPLM